MQHTKARLGESLKKIWESKIMHSQYIIRIDKQLIREKDTFLSLSRGDLKAETLSQIRAAQDQALRTKYHITNIANRKSKCRLCQKFYEAIEHFILASTILSKEKYVKRHDRVYVNCICKEIWEKITK